MAQVKYKDKRTSAERREYFAQYHRNRRMAVKLAPVVEDRADPMTENELRAATNVRLRYLETHKSWPESRHEYPETISETLARRVK